MTTTSQRYEVIIIGSGVAGFSASIYAARGGNNPLVIKGDEPGGQLTLTTDVANYPGFPEGISGPELINNMEEQSKKFGAEITNGIVSNVERNNSEKEFIVSLTNGEQYVSEAVIVASGASARTLGIPGEDELLGFGVSTCATCDGAFFKGEDMIVVGGGDAAMEEATFLTRFADTVYLVHRREDFRAEQYWVDKVLEQTTTNGETEITDAQIQILKNTELTEIKGSEENGVQSVSLVSHPEGYPTEKLNQDETEFFEMDVGAVFLAIGHTPNTSFLPDTVSTDETGYVLYEGKGKYETETEVSGLFVAGDVADKVYQQAATASGMGVKAALDVNSYLDS